MPLKIRFRPAPKRPDLTADQILAWADAHHTRTGEWTTRRAGEIPDAPGETWGAVEKALGLGLRGLPGGSSLPKLVAECRSVVAGQR